VIGQRLVEIARSQPDAPAVIFSSPGGDAIISYSQLLALGEEVRRRLEARGVRPHEPVIAVLSPGPDATAVFVACMFMGAIYMPVNPSWREAEIAWLIPAVNPSAVVTREVDRTLWEKAGIAPNKIVTLDRLEIPNTPPEYRVAQLPDESPGTFQLSSGSTGRPKIVVKTGGRLLESLSAIARFIGLTSSHRVFAPTPLHFGFGFTWNLVLPLISGATIVQMETFEPVAASDVIARHRVNTLCGAPVLFNLFTDAGLANGSLAGIELSYSAGATLSAAVKAKWKQLTGHDLRQAYGTVEGGMIAVQLLGELPESCVGRIIDGNEVRILVEGAPQSPGVGGEIAIRSPGVMTGYLNDPEATAAIMTDGFLRTGDTGWLDQQGRLFFTGRIRPWINAGGVKVDPIEVQNAIRGIAGVRDCLVRAEPGPRGLDLVAAVIVLEPGLTLTRADVIRHCREHLADYKIPRVFHWVDSMATDLTGKALAKWAQGPPNRP